MTDISWITIFKAAFMPFTILAAVPLLIWVERRGSAFIQDRPGPNRARIGSFTLLGLPHVLADAIKFVTKESFIPSGAYKPLYYIAPFFAVAPALSTIAVVPFAAPLDVNGQTIHFQGIPLESGLIFIFALTALSVYSIVLGGWSSNNRYSLLGGLRASAQMISYEVSLILTLLGALMIYGTAELNTMVEAQTHLPYMWGFVLQPVGFILFLVVGVAEIERIPFDIPEAESEVVAGYHTEYSGLKFSMYMFGQYVTSIIVSAIVVTMFLGGWQVPFLSTQMLNDMLGSFGRVVVQMGSFTTKMALMLWFLVWLRWTLPRFRYDQLMRLGWKVILPITLVNIFVTALVVLLIDSFMLS